MSDAEPPTSLALEATPGRRAPEREPVRVVGLLAEFDTVDRLLPAATRCRDEGFTRWDCHTPFPVHGLDRAMGLRPTVLPWVILGGGAAGALTGFLLQWFTNAFDYPFRASGKPYLSFAIYIPVMFELTVLFGALAAFFGLLALNALPQYYHPAFRSDRFGRATNDRFFITIEAGDPLFDEEQVAALFKSLESVHVERLEE